MPANLPPEAMNALDKSYDCKNLEDKIKAMEEAISLIPKHKGTEKLIGNLRRKISQIKDDIEKKAGVGKAGQKGIRKEGAAQACLIGIENSGKSYLLNLLTNKKVKSTQVPFETQKPEVGMYDHEGVKIQLIDLPSITPDFYFLKDGPYVLNLVRTTDLIILVLKQGLDPEKQEKLVLHEMAKNRIMVNKKAPSLRIKRTGTGGFEFVGENYLEGNVKEFKKALQKRKYNSAVVEVFAPVSLEDFENYLSNYVYKKMLVLKNFEGAGQKVWDAFNMIKIYTKEPGKRKTRDPIALPLGATVKLVAEHIHKDFVKEFRFARVWGKSADFPGQRVGLTHELADGDTVQLHA